MACLQIDAPSQCPDSVDHIQTSGAMHATHQPWRSIRETTRVHSVSSTHYLRCVGFARRAPRQIVNARVLAKTA